MAIHIVTAGEKLIVPEWIEQYKKKQGPNSLISKEVRDRIQIIIVTREGRSSQMLQKHVFEIIESVAGCTENQADNYYQYSVA